MKNPNAKFLQEFLTINARTLWLFISNRQARALIVSEWNHERELVQTGRPMIDAVLNDCFKPNRKPRRAKR